MDSSRKKNGGNTDKERGRVSVRDIERWRKKERERELGKLRERKSKKRKRYQSQKGFFTGSKIGVLIMRCTNLDEFIAKERFYTLVIEK